MHQPLAYVHPGAKIAQNVVIEPFVTIDNNVVIEEGTWIGSHVSIMSGARIGKNCRIFPGAIISAIPQDLKFIGEETTAEIGDNTTIREFTTINRGTKSKGKTEVGSNCLLMAYVHVAHDCKIGNNCVLVNSVSLAGEVVVDDWAILGGLSGVHQFVHIGAHSFIAGSSSVRKDVPPYTKAGREPLSYVGINSIGLRRRGFTSQEINEIQDIYRILFVRGYNFSQAIAIIEAEFSTSEVRDEILSFILNTDRGIMRGYRKDNKSR